VSIIFRGIGSLGAVVLFSALYAGPHCSAQTQAQAPLQVPNPHYVTINESTIVNAPVEQGLGTRRKVLRYNGVDEFARVGELQIPPW
jgi:hypothetical protein